jgi:hypothetical protein
MKPSATPAHLSSPAKKGHLVLEDCGSGNVAHEASRNVSKL